MSNFGTILKYELKKLILNRASILAVFGCAAFMLGVINSSIKDPRLLKVGDRFFTSYQEAAILYTLLTALIFRMIIIIYRRQDAI